MTPEKFFTSKQQLARYYYAVEIAKQLQKYQADGYMIFDGEELIENKIIYKTEFNDDEWCIVGVQCENSLYIYVGIQYGSMDQPWICSKESIEESFENFYIINPKDIKKLKL